MRDITLRMPFFRSFPLSSIVLVLFLSCLSATSRAATGNWTSTVTGGTIAYTTTDPTAPAKDFNGAYITVVYLENLGLKKLGQNTNATDVAWLLSKGYRVIELNYLNNAKAVTPTINADIIAINTALNSGSFCGLSTCSKYKSYILFEGYRIARDVSYFKDDPTVYNVDTHYTVGDSLHMDIIYPANTSVAVPVVLSFSYSNSYPNYDSSLAALTDVYKDQRMNLGNTFAGFNDSFLEGSPANGVAWAIADHPKYCTWGGGKPVGGANKTYASYETNPDAVQKVKSAIRTLRALGNGLGLSGKIGVYGFSRGSTAGSMAIGDRTVTNFENAGLYIGTSDDVQVAALGSGVFDYTQIYNTVESDIGNLTTNCALAWGAMANNLATWQSQGSSYLVQSVATAPVIFFYNTTDASYYQDQIAQLKSKLDVLGVATSTITNYGTGHAVPQTSAALSTVYAFFNKYLNPPTVTTGLNDPLQMSVIDMQIFPNPATDEVQLKFNLTNTGKVSISLYNLSGVLLYNAEEQYGNSGLQTYSLSLQQLRLSQGIYYVKVTTDGIQGIQKLIKK